MQNNGYSADVSQDAALIVLMVQEYASSCKGYTGRTAIQKMIYFARELGVPIDYRFQIYYYGPYAESLASDVERMVAYGVLEDASNNRGQYSDYRLGPNDQHVFEGHRSVIDKYGTKIAQVASMFKDLKPDALELLSTLHFIDRKLKAEGSSRPKKEQVMTEFRDVKGEKFAQGQIEDAYDAMQRVGLLAR